MRTQTVYFEKVSIKRKKVWTDKKGKRRQRTREFMQTISPWNKNKKGEVKGYFEIMEEITKEANKWMKEKENE